MIPLPLSMIIPLQQVQIQERSICFLSLPIVRDGEVFDTIVVPWLGLIGSNSLDL